MVEEKIIIKTQYYENYNVGPKGFNTYGDKKPKWKPKGSYDFVIELDTDLLLYAKNVEAIFAKMIFKHNTEAEKFEYRDYEIVYEEPRVLGTKEDFLILLKEELEYES